MDSTQQTNENEPLKSVEEKDNELQEDPVIVESPPREQSIDDKNEPTEAAEPIPDQNADEYKEDAADDHMDVVEKESINNDIYINKNEENDPSSNAKTATSEPEPEQDAVHTTNAENATDKIDDTTQQQTEPNEESEAKQQELEPEEIAVTGNDDQPSDDNEYAKISSEPEPNETEANGVDSTNVENEYVKNAASNLVQLLKRETIDDTIQQPAQPKVSEAKQHELEPEKIGVINNDDQEDQHKELVVSEKTEEQNGMEMQVVIQEKTENKQETEDAVDIGDKEEEKPSCGERFIKNWSKWIYVFMVVATLSLVGVLIGLNQPGEEAGIIIGLVCFNMVLSGILMPCIGLLFIKAWTKNTWWLVFFVVYIAIIADVIAFGTYLGGLMEVVLILYGVIKILVMYYAFIFARIDGKHFISSIIAGYINWKWIKHETKIYKLIPLYIICLFIQICMFSIGCMAFLFVDGGAPVALFIVALILFIWLINTPRHFLSYMNARVVAKYLRESEREAINEDDDIIKLAFKDAYNKFVTITIGSFLVTTTPIWYFITNLMTGIKIVLLGLMVCCAPCAGGDDEEANAVTCIAGLITCVSAIGYAIAWIGRKISKWTLRVTAKLLLISAGFLNITFWKAIWLQNSKIKKETKKTFNSDMLFLDNAVLSTNTHLCILISSIGAWLTYLIKPEATVICWIAGYCGCRTMFEMVDVILLTFLIAWFVEPRIIYEDQTLYEGFKVRTRAMLERLYPNETEEFYAEAIKILINIEIEEVTGLQKTTDPTNITNVERTVTTIDAEQERKQIVHAPTGQIIAVQQNEAIMMNQEVTEYDRPTDVTVNNAIEMPNNNAVTYDNNDENIQIR